MLPRKYRIIDCGQYSGKATGNIQRSYPNRIEIYHGVCLIIKASFTPI
jgi:hypothetical protein